MLGDRIHYHTQNIDKMTLVVRKPKLNRSSLPAQMDALFSDFFSPVETSTVSRRPAYNLIENNDAFRLELAVPGLERADISVQVEDQQLLIEGQATIERPEDEQVRRHGFSPESFQRTFQLGEVIDTEGIHARCENGVLYIELPKREEAKAQPPRKIEIA